MRGYDVVDYWRRCMVFGVGSVYLFLVQEFGEDYKRGGSA